MSGHLFGWWQVAENALRFLTTPTTDVVASDRCVAQLLRGSAIVKGAQRARETVYRAWLDSRTRAIVETWRRVVRPPESGSRAAVAGVVTIAAALTVLSLEWLARLAR